MLVGRGLLVSLLCTAAAVAAAGITGDDVLVYKPHGAFRPTGRMLSSTREKWDAYFQRRHLKAVEGRMLGDCGEVLSGGQADSNGYGMSYAGPSGSGHNAGGGSTTSSFGPVGIAEGEGYGQAQGIFSGVRRLQQSATALGEGYAFGGGGAIGDNPSQYGYASGSGSGTATGTSSESGGGGGGYSSSIGGVGSGTAFGVGYGIGTGPGASASGTGIANAGGGGSASNPYYGPNYYGSSPSGQPNPCPEPYYGSSATQPSSSYTLYQPTNGLATGASTTGPPKPTATPQPTPPLTTHAVASSLPPKSTSAQPEGFTSFLTNLLNLKA